MSYVVFGERLTLADMAAVANVGRSTIIQRLRRGMSPEDAVVAPHAHFSSAHAAVGHIKAIAQAHGIAYTTLHARLRRGLTIEQALAMPIRSEIRGHDFTGRKVGILDVVGRGPVDGKKRNWLCRCVHGETCVRSSQALMAKVVVCDCKHAACPVSGVRYRARIKQIVGREFGRLVVREEVGKYVVCDCACGKSGVKRRRAMVRTGKVRSCGCLRRETTAQMRRKGAIKYEVFGEWLSIGDIAAASGLTPNGVMYRINTGHKPEDIVIRRQGQVA